MPRLRSVLVLSLAAASIHCASSSSDPSEEDESVASESEALVTHCWADIERPLPTASILPIGTTLTLRTSTNIHCPQGVSEKLVYRFYVDGPNGTVFATPDGTWGTRLQTFDTSTLPPARYRIFAYSMPASMVTAWVANDPVARAAPHRTSYSYVTMVQTHWATGTWSACSSQCGDGTETR
ncbi:MAG TPA: thrombospondin type-1 domain-containing protein, partial [Labilithrix sp.]